MIEIMKAESKTQDECVFFLARGTPTPIQYKPKNVL